jgi:hypothetical protein
MLAKTRTTRTTRTTKRWTAPELSKSHEPFSESSACSFPRTATLKSIRCRSPCGVVETMSGIRRCQGFPVARVVEVVWWQSRERFAFQACPLCYKTWDNYGSFSLGINVAEGGSPMDWRSLCHRPCMSIALCFGLYLGSAVYIMEDLRCIIAFDRAIAQILVKPGYASEALLLQIQTLH